MDRDSQLILTFRYMVAAKYTYADGKMFLDNKIQASQRFNIDGIF